MQEKLRVKQCKWNINTTIVNNNGQPYVGWSVIKPIISNISDGVCKQIL